MRYAQFRILTRVLDKITIPDYIHAFEKDKSIPRMAQLHVGKQVVISVDIKDFFQSIKQIQLNTIFQDVFGMNEKPARTLSELCTYKSFVPQGALTSPKIANMITALTFGPQIKQYCEQEGLTLSIYADDITISSTNPATDVREILSYVTTKIQEAGFRINHRKTKVMWASQRQYVCGVVVNAKTNLILKERRKLRAIVHNITKNGVETEALKSNIEPGMFASHIMGRLNWFKQLNMNLGDKYTAKLKEHLNNKQKVIDVPKIAINLSEEETVPF